MPQEKSFPTNQQLNIQMMEEFKLSPPIVGSLIYAREDVGLPPQIISTCSRHICKEIILGPTWYGIRAYCNRHVMASELSKTLFPDVALGNSMNCESCYRIRNSEQESILVAIIEGGNITEPASLSSPLHPSHYHHNTPYEVFKVLEAWGLMNDFLLGNVIKYVARAGKKSASTLLEDIKKAKVYLDRKISSLEKDTNNESL